MKAFPLVLMAAILGGIGMPTAMGAAPVELLSAAEASQPDMPMPKAGKLPAGDLPLLHGESKTGPVAGAPQIIVETPEQGVGVATPFPVKIRFVAVGGAKINLDSLKIDVLKIVPISLLSRVKPYLGPTGINVPEAKIPAGTYNIRIAIADDQGRLGMTTQMWTIR